MGTSYVEFNGDGFWVRDAYLEAWLGLLAKHIALMSDAPAWLQTLQREWVIQATSGFNGFVSAHLDDYLTSAERRKQVIAVTTAGLEWLQKNGPVVSPDDLNELTPGNGRWRLSLPADHFVAVGETFLRLLREELPSAARGGADCRSRTRPSAY